jgi:primosomal protein N' (replication factor Y) (superfamily II helicase)
MDEQVPGVSATSAGRTLDLETLRRAPKQRELLTLVRAAPEGVAVADLNARLGPCAATLRSLHARGLLETCRLVPAGPVTHAPRAEPAPVPSSIQIRPRRYVGSRPSSAGSAPSCSTA